MKVSAWVTGLTCLALPTASSWGQCAPMRTAIGTTHAANIRLVGDVSSGALDLAMDMWNGTCGSKLPDFVTSGEGIEVTVNAVNGRNNLPQNADCSGCGCALPAFAGPDGEQTLVGGIIWVFSQTSDGETCHNPIQTYAHELGHLFGLLNGSCSNRIMGPSLSAAVTVSAEDCSAADSYWMTPKEVQNQGPQEPDPGMPTPLILDLDHDGAIQTTGVSEPVRFDFTGNGQAESLTWTFWESEEGFLWLDLDQSDLVDNGGELFGNSTILPSRRPAEHGFAALAVYDTLVEGGNSDGVISDLDRVWQRLRLWIDRNHDGVSQRDEIATLGDYEVIAINLAYSKSDMVDGAGNGHFLQGFFATQSQALGFTTYRYHIMHDVFFRWVGE